MADRVITTKEHICGKYPPISRKREKKWCALAASETSVVKQRRSVKKGGKSLLLVEYHE